MFFIDKYKSHDSKNPTFHKEIISKLKKMSIDKSVPHIMFYGPPGAGKQNLVNMFLHMIYGDAVDRLTDVKYTIKGSGSVVNTEIVKQSCYHIVIEPKNNNFDKYLIQEIVKEYARSKLFNVFAVKDIFKVVLINNINDMTYYAQTALRRTMEKYSNTCRFIMCSNSLSKVIEPLRSRCMPFRVPLPTDNEMFRFIYNIGLLEGIDLNMRQYNQIIEKSNGNIKKCLWLLEFHKHNIPITTSYDDAIEVIVNLLSKGNCDVMEMRKKIYDIIITNIECTDIIKDITSSLMQKDITDKQKYDISFNAAKYEHNLVRSRREFLHIEAYIQKVIDILSPA